MATYAVSGMTCKKCVAKVQEAVATLDANAAVQLDPPRLVISDSVSLDAVNERLAPFGKYHAAPIGAGLPAWVKTYQPLLILTGYLVLVAVVAADTWNDAMRYFMAGFFIAFSFFKMLDVRSFAAGYARYDLLAARWPVWGLVYPFIELLLGVAYATNFMPTLTNSATLIIQLVAGAGVVRTLMNKEQVRCACVGNVLNLPVGAVTLIEDFGMAAMAALMLLLA